MDPSMMDEYAPSPSCCKNSSRYPALARLGSSVPKMVGVDCGAIQPGGACFEPNMVSAHAAYAMNQLYQAADNHPWNCDFRQSATVTSTNPRMLGFCSANGSGYQQVTGKGISEMESAIIEVLSSCLPGDDDGL
ncbi:hypothetical protein ZWY2020_035947 [Hordeum vulgare]|nr:hypothetical protein ZWY2020_035947 [Hordeum vulgare]